ncbi:MAG: RNA-binding cell elongation regulator Jag/EloR [Tissierellaceae bacterium]|nr:RNA-binding cell elongation regulator Jag/EloR [Tissierellaceae bacterium]
MRYVIKQSKTVEDAIKDALLELEVTEEDVEIEVIEEASKGLFGIIGTKEAKVKVTVTYDPISKTKEFLDKIFTSMNIKAGAEINKEDDVLYVDIISVDPIDKGIIIGKRGNTLDSIQYLLSLVINKGRDKYTRVVLDIENYRKKREETLIRLAEKMAEKAKYTKRPVKLEPMNPSERRIIHSALQKHNGITTYSEGDEPFRRVVIQAK